MEFFYIIVLSIAVIFLILILTLIGVLMKQSKKTGGTFPPIVNNCPDYWVISTDGKSCTIPIKKDSTTGYTTEKNAGSLYGTNSDLDIIDPSGTSVVFPIKTPGFVTGGSTIDFTDAAWSAQGKTSTCAQKQWAQKWGITWDGITNNNTC